MAKAIRITAKTQEKISNALTQLALANNSKKVQVTYKRLAEATGLSIATVIRGVQYLVAEGFVTILDEGTRRSGKTYDVGYLLRLYKYDRDLAESADDAHGALATHDFDHPQLRDLQRQIEALQTALAELRSQVKHDENIQIVHRITLNKREELWHVRK